MDLAVNDLQLVKLVGDSAKEESFQLLNRQGVDLILLVDYRFEVFEAGEAFQNRGKVVSREATVAEADPVDLSVIERHTGCCDALALALPKDVVLQAECLPVDLLEDWKWQTVILLALIVVLEDGVVFVLLLVLNDVLNIPLFILLEMLHLLDKCVCFPLDGVLFCNVHGNS